MKFKFIVSEALTVMNMRGTVWWVVKPRISERARYFEEIYRHHFHGGIIGQHRNQRETENIAGLGGMLMECDEGYVIKYYRRLLKCYFTHSSGEAKNKHCWSRGISSVPCYKGISGNGGISPWNFSLVTVNVILPSSHWIRGWVIPWGCLDAVEKNLYTCRESNHRPPGYSLFTVLSKISWLSNISDQHSVQAHTQHK
jgi:hypothetical protein